jgi:hypothetical protein
LPEEGEIAEIQRLILANELEKDAEFEANLTNILSSAEAARDAIAQQWASARDQRSPPAGDRQTSRAIRPV